MKIPEFNLDKNEDYMRRIRHLPEEEQQRILERDRDIFEELAWAMRDSRELSPEEKAARLEEIRREEENLEPLPEYKIDEQTGIPYRLEGDYYVPDLRAEEVVPSRIGVYGRQRWRFLKECKPEILDEMILAGNVNEMLAELDELAAERVRTLTEQLEKANPAPDKMKHQIEWVAHMNMLKAQAEEIMRAEMIYV